MNSDELDDPAEDRCTERCGRLATVSVLVAMSTLSVDQGEDVTYVTERRCARHTRP